MVFIKKVISHLFQKPSLYLFVVLIIFTSDRYHRWVSWKSDTQGPFYNDIAEYYAVLPAVFLQHSFSDGKEISGSDKYKIQRRTIGMAILYSPFFFISDQVAKSFGYVRDGYSIPYIWGIHWGSIIYSLLGLWFCRKSLLLFFTEIISCISLICFFLALIFFSTLMVVARCLMPTYSFYIVFLFSVV